MTDEYQNRRDEKTGNEQFIAYCGLYCKACPSFTSGKCDGCRSNSAKSAVVYKQCRVKPCCVENGFYTCADCTISASVKDCKKYNPLLLRIASWVESSDRSRAIEMIQTKGRTVFAVYMEDKNWVCFKTKDSFFNRRFGKKVNEK
jgi:hypothetical protein